VFEKVQPPLYRPITVIDTAAKYNLNKKPCEVIYLKGTSHTMTTAVIKTTALNYYFSKHQKTLDDINLEVEHGSIYGFLGPNGAGKTTTLRLLLGLLKNQSGAIEIFGEDFAKHRMGILKRAGSLIEQPSLYGQLTAVENLEVYRPLYSATKSRIVDVLQLVGLENTGSKKAKQFSLGMKQRLAIAVALLPSPELLILDEPTNGLDPNGIVETRELIKRLNAEHGVTILVSSHILAEVEKMATHLGIIHLGKLLFQGTLSELQQLKNRQRTLQISTSNNEAAAKILQPQYAVTFSNPHIVIPYKNDAETATINRLLMQQGLDVFLLQPQQNNLEQLFMDLTTHIA
jgi:ABC-type multidrug transport system ATPase subunit